MAKEGSIGPNGRSVCCARCQAVWFAKGTDPDALALVDNETVLIAEDVGPSLALESKDEPTPDPPVMTVPKTQEVGAHVLLREKADAEKLSKRKKLISGIWAIPILALSALACMAVFNRQGIVTKNPKAASLYQSLGMTVKANGLDIQGLSSERLVVDGELILRVTGEVVNLTSQAKNAPLVQFRLENRSGESVADWFVEPGTVPAKDRVLIETDYPAPPIDGVELRYRFSPEE